MNLAKSSVKLFLANIASAGIQFLGITIFARELGASELGIFFLFQALLGILSIPADFGLRGAVEKRISEGESQGPFLTTAIFMKSIPIAMIIISILFTRQYINNYLGSELAGFLALAIVLQEAAQLAIFVLKGELRVGETAVLNVARYGTWVGGGIILIKSGYGAEGLVFSLLAGLIFVFVWGWYKSSISLGRPSFAHGRSLTNYGKYNVVSSIGGYFYSWMDIAIIGLFLTQTHVGAYEVAWRVTAVTLLFSKAIATTLLPQISQWDAEGAKDQIELVVYESITPSMLLVIPAFFGTLVFSREILELLFGQEFTIASIVLVILAGEKILQSVHVVLGRALHAIDKPNLAAKATIVSIFLNLVMNVVLILSFGIIGAAIATTFSFAVNGILHLRYLSENIKVEFPYKEIGWCIISSTVMAIILWLVQNSIKVGNLSKLFLIIIFGVGIYGTLIMIYEPIRIRFFRLMRQWWT